MKVTIIKSWEDDATFFLDAEGYYKITYDKNTKIADVSLIRSDIGTFATASESDVPQKYLHEIARNM